MPNIGIAQYRVTLSRIAVDIHSDMMGASADYLNRLKRKIYITPTNFQDLLFTYVELLRQYLNILPLQIRKYQVFLLS